MDQLPALGTNILSIIQPTTRIYTPILRANAVAIKGTSREEFSYGPHPRQKLDVYAPSPRADADKGSPPPVVLFLPGGGFVRGGKRFSLVPDDLQYANVGHFFASHGFETVIADYRLAGVDANGVRGAVWPMGSEDVASVVAWIVERLGSPGRKLFLFGASAGGSHVATFTFHPDFAATRASVSSPTGPMHLAGVVLASAGLSLNPALLDPESKPAIGAYYGRDESTWQSMSPVGLLKKGTFKTALPPIVIATAEYDPEVVHEALKAFESAWAASGQKGELTHMKAWGHNHISEMTALGSGLEKEEEEWGLALQGWMRRRAAGIDGDNEGRCFI